LAQIKRRKKEGGKIFLLKEAIRKKTNSSEGEDQRLPTKLLEKEKGGTILVWLRGLIFKREIGPHCVGGRDEAANSDVEDVPTFSCMRESGQPSTLTSEEN